MATVEIGDEPREGRLIQQVAPDTRRIERAHPDIDEGAFGVGADSRIDAGHRGAREGFFGLRVAHPEMLDVATRHKTRPRACAMLAAPKPTISGQVHELQPSPRPYEQS